MIMFVYNIAVICAFIAMSIHFSKWYLVFIALLFILFPDWGDDE